MKNRGHVIRSLNCALRKDGKVFGRIRVRSDLTGATVGEARGNTLVAP